jgi:hydroxymethylpyrimidine pyrophosphatase-like HAD family hydrolase
LAVIAIDFDHTIVDGFTPIEGAREAINLWRENGHKVVVHSCNSTGWIKNVLDNNDIRYDYIWVDKGKPICDIYVDDKGYRFQGDWTHEQLEVLKLLEGFDNRKW